MTTALVIAALAAGLYMAWNVGANDVANAMGTSIGSGAMTLRTAVVLAAVFEFCGAFFVGGSVSQTIRKGIVEVDALRRHAVTQRADAAPPAPQLSPDDAPGETPAEAELRAKLIAGMLSALLASAIWLNVATFFSQPVSTTHAIVGAVVGFAIAAAGPRCVVWPKMAQIAASWVVSPIVGAALAYGLYRCIQTWVLRTRHPVFMAKRAVPICYGAVGFILGLSVLYKVMHLDKATVFKALPLALILGLAAGAASRTVLLRSAARRRVRRKDRYAVVEGWFGRIQIVTACYMAFAHGANDVANAIGPLAAVVHFATGGQIASKAPVPWWLLALGGLGIILGLATYGYKVIEAVGKRITEITPTRGFAAGFGTASTVLICSLMGLPISTTLVLVGAVMGVGMARGFAAIDLKIIRRIFASWVLTIPVSAVLAAAIYKCLMLLA